MISAVTVCVEYADFLRHTLPRLRAQVSRVIIVTVAGDESEDVAKDNDCEVVISRRVYENGRFCLGKARNEGFEALCNPGWVLSIDADIVVPDMSSLPLEIGCLHGMQRRQATNSQDIDGDWSSLPMVADRRTHHGYFQLFHAADKRLQVPWFPENSKSSSHDDRTFRFRWPKSLLRVLPVECLHLGQTHIDWLGRVSQEFK